MPPQLRAHRKSFLCKMTKYRRERMKKINCLATMNHYLFEICFPNELLRGGRKIFLCDLF